MNRSRLIRWMAAAVASGGLALVVGCACEMPRPGRPCVSAPVPQVTCDAPCQHQVCYSNPECHGFVPTCWHPWPACCGACPPPPDERNAWSGAPASEQWPRAAPPAEAAPHAPLPPVQPSQPPSAPEQLPPGQQGRVGYSAEPTGFTANPAPQQVVYAPAAGQAKHTAARKRQRATSNGSMAPVAVAPANEAKDGAQSAPPLFKPLTAAMGLLSFDNTTAHPAAKTVYGPADSTVAR